MTMLKTSIPITLLFGTLGMLMITILIVILILVLHDRTYKQAMSRYHQTLLTSKIEIQEQTFNKISQELHDNIGQLLVIAKMQVNILQDSCSDNDKTEEVKKTLGIAINDVRNIAKTLSSDSIIRNGFIKTIEEELARINKSGIIKTVFTVQGNVRKMEDPKALILYRIIQEVIQNIIKHSLSTEMNIGVAFREEELEINIKDNGKGFNVEEQLSIGKGMGLKNIVDRTQVIGGYVKFGSKEGEGTKVLMVLPYVAKTPSKLF
jgi:two-component system, NarL family, sensor kinase